MNFKTSVKIKGKEQKKKKQTKIMNIKQYTPRTILVITAHSVKSIFLLTEGA